MTTENEKEVPAVETPATETPAEEATTEAPAESPADEGVPA